MLSDYLTRDLLDHVLSWVDLLVRRDVGVGENLLQRDPQLCSRGRAVFFPGWICDDEISPLVLADQHECFS